ncbi:glycoside hydrolase family 2 protein [Microbacterium sp.]|uniref:glycoside hydrolase family 2 protein n=1 Tax=Microbacterium sp. TaxID=51671 RepID=UPI0033412514
MRRRLLHDGWTVRTDDHRAPRQVRDAPVPAVVPGCVHSDLLAAGLIGDPFRNDQEAAQRWIGETDWVYRTEFDWAPDGAERHDLVFDGLDTVADVTLNGVAVLSVANQHRSHRAAVGGVLRAGANELVVAFRSPVRWANAQSQVLGARPRPYPLPYEAIRKSASSFGWDWGIATATSGIGKSVALESWSGARIAELRVRTETAGEGGTVVVDALVERGERDRDLPLELSVEAAGVRGTARVGGGADAVHVEVEVAEVRRWWPAGHGAQPLYDVAVALRDDEGGARHRLDRRVGFRTLRWDTTPDADGTPFSLVVNDVPVWVKGVNWIPDDALVTRVDRERCRHRLEQARDAHVNLVRVWGGGVYESDDFYDACDELGLLTWQDFLFACAAYPEEEPLRSEVAAEAREQIVRLSSHASLALLCGNNENLMGHHDWGWERALDGATWGAFYYFDLLPRLVAELAPATPYIPGSPFHPGGGDPNDDRHGPVHLWTQWNSEDWRTYSRHTPRFVAEFGWQGPPAWTTLREAVDDDPLTPESPGMLVHQKAADGNAKLRDGLLAHVRVPRGMRDWHWAMQWNQAAAMRHAIEHFRASSPVTRGSIVWQLNDCWPVTSWSAIDYAGRLKPVWYALRAAYRPRLITLQERDGEVAAMLVNDEADAWEGELVVRRRSFDGTVRAESSLPFRVPPRASDALPLDAAVRSAGDAASELITAEAGSYRGLLFFAEPRASALSAPRLRVRTAPTTEGSTVEVSADGLVRDLFLHADLVHPDAVVDEGLVTLLPGETARFALRHPPGARFSPSALRTLNDLVATGPDAG